MVLFNYATKELTAKIVYYGPGLCGKTTNLQFIHENLPDTVKGKMLSLATKTDRTLFFDFLPIDLGEIRGMKTRVQLYTVPGQVFYNETRRLVLKGADGIVFVADSQETMLGANVESFKNLEENLKAHGMSLADMPHVIQFNKRDLPRLSGIEDLNAGLNRYNAPFYESVATTGIGVQDTLKAVVKLVLLHLTKKYDPKSASSPRAERPAPVAAPAPAAKAATPARPTSARTVPVSEPQPAQVGAGFTPVAATTGSIPLSPLETMPVSRTFDEPAARRGAPPPPRPRGGADPVRSIPLSADPLGDEPFGEDEIEGLVSEVEEFAAEPRAPAEDGVWLGAPETGAESEVEPSIVEPSEDAVWLEEGDDLATAKALFTPAPDAGSELASEPADSPFATAESMFGTTLSVEEFVDPTESEPADDGVLETRGAQEESPFEIDRGFDPEWSADSGVESAPPEEPAEPAVDFETAPLVGDFPASSGSSIVGEVGPEAVADDSEATPAQELGAEVPDSEDGVYLTEVVGDEDLFRDGSLEIARLAPGEASEIVVPVELGQGETARRFKLSVRLRLDPIDEA